MLQSKYWIDPDGIVIEIGLSISHEEFVNSQFNMSVEEAFTLGWIRIQAFETHYLLVDHHLSQLKETQRASLEKFFERDYQVISVTRKDVSIDFCSNPKKTAYGFASEDLGQKNSTLSSSLETSPKRNPSFHARFINGSR